MSEAIWPAGPGGAQEAGVTDFDLRVDALTGARVVITGSRQKRPNLPTTDCPFCVGGTEAPDSYDVRWFVNRWPAIPDGRAEVILYAPDHDASFWSIGVEAAEKVVALWAQRTSELGARSDVAYVLAFENRGPEVGATIAHPHGQIYAFPEVPEAVRREFSGATCALCDRAAAEAEADRVIVDSPTWRAVVPEAASWPYELVIAPLAHVPDLSDAAAACADLAAVLVAALRALDRLFDAPMPYMLWVHQRPTDGAEWPMAHVHLHIAPLLRSPGVARFVAAGELGSGVFFNPVAPEVAAEQLRTAAASPGAVS